MVKNTKGGKHHKKGKKHREEKTDGKIIYAENNQVYAMVTKKVGGSRINVSCSDTKDRSGLIPGKFFKRVWMNQGDIILCELNPDDDSQCYILHKYSYKDASLLKSQGHITFNIPDNDEDDNGYDFVSDEENDDQEKDNKDNANKMLDIKNVKNNKKEFNSDSDSDSSDDIQQINNSNNTLKSTKWTKNNKTEDTKEYTIDDL